VHTVKLGSSGLNVSPIALGTSVFGSQCTETESFDILDAALEAGINFIDTADMYPAGSQLTGATEEVVGKWLSRHREEVVIATKCGHWLSDRPNDGGLSRKHIIEACHGSLRRLNVETIDVFYLHVMDASVSLEETFTALDSLVRAGKVHYLGVSNFAAGTIWRAQQVIARESLSPITTVLTKYNLLDRQAADEILPNAAVTGTGVFAWNALAGGMLTGKYRRDSPPPVGSRYSDTGEFGDVYRKRYWYGSTFDLVDLLLSVANSEGVSPGEAALAWTLSQRCVTGALVGASKPDHVQMAARAAGIKLSPEALETLNSWRPVMD
jgi:aryl-alcohol dehydrogenase-like predicted oxidoreductase